MKHCDHCGQKNAQSYSADVKRDAGQYTGPQAYGDLCDNCLKKLRAIIEKFFAVKQS